MSHYTLQTLIKGTTLSREDTCFTPFVNYNYIVLQVSNTQEFKMFLLNCLMAILGWFLARCNVMKKTFQNINICMGEVVFWHTYFTTTPTYTKIVLLFHIIFLSLRSCTFKGWTNLLIFCLYMLTLLSSIFLYFRRHHIKKNCVAVMS